MSMRRTLRDCASLVACLGISLRCAAVLRRCQPFSVLVVAHLAKVGIHQLEYLTSQVYAPASIASELGVRGQFSTWRPRLERHFATNNKQRRGESASAHQHMSLPLLQILSAFDERAAR